MTSAEHNLADVDRFQNTLRTLLNAYVNGMYLRRRAKYGYPLLWQLSPYAAAQAMHELTRVALPLRHNPHLSPLLDYLKGQTADMPASPESAVVEVIAQGYRCLKQILVERKDTTHTRLPNARPFCARTYLELDRDYFRPVVALEQHLTHVLSPYLTDAWIHGSVADLGLAKGYSDLDVLCVLSDETATTPDLLRSFARRCYRAHTYLYAFDPLQHHGLQVMTAIDWLAYPCSWLPLEALGEGVSLFCQTELVATRESRADALEAFERTVDHLLGCARRGWIPSNAYELKYYISVLMLLPTLFWQARGDFCTKRESFAKLDALEGQVDQAVIRTASQIRSRWPDVRAPYILRFLHPRVLGALSVSRTQPMLEMSSAALIREAASFALRLHELAEDGLGQRIVCTGPHLAITNAPVRYSLADYEAARECYVALASSERSVVAVLECGTVSEPGLSDLDFVVLVDDHAPIKGAALSIRGLSLAHADLIMHEAVVLPPSLAPHLKEWFPFAEPSILYQRGRSSTPSIGDSGADTSYIQSARLLEKLHGYRQWFLRVERFPQLDARWALALLKSLQYSILSVEHVTGTVLTEASSFSDDLKTLRGAWFETGRQLWRHEQLRSLYRRAGGLHQQCLAAIENWLRSQGWLVTQTAGSGGALDRLVALYAREPLLAPVLGAAPGPPPSTPFESYLAQRAAILALHRRFLHAHGLAFGSLFPGD